MGVSQVILTTDSKDTLNSLNPLQNTTFDNASIDPSEDNNYTDDYNDLKLKTHLKNMILKLGFTCFRPIIDENQTKNTNLEHNKAWLLAESGGCTTDGNNEPQSVHSSFRFNLCSQVELESMNMSSSTKATVLMVNLDNGFNESKAQELKWRRIQSLERSISPVANSLVRFSYGEILSSTRNFSKGRVLGRGALSFVFRGRVGLLKSTVAIKRLDKDDKESSKAFCRELMIASSLEHRNIVPLIGFCIDSEEGLFLVYNDLTENPSADKKRGAKNSPRLPWSLCDFGLATWIAAPSVPFLCKTVKGTFGYLAPEYFQHGKISDKTDVYAFGVVLLELLTGRKPIDSRRPSGEENLVQWAKPLLHKGRGAVEELLDPRLKCTIKNSTEITQVMQAAAACISIEESRRPSINGIVALLKGEEEPIFSSRKKSNFSGVIDCYSQVQQTKSERLSHLDLAMLGVQEFEDNDHLYCR
ncbi:hypothetical protein ACFE04_007636 [Oxalis oulophora]